MIVIDTSVVLAIMNRADNDHARVRDWMAATTLPQLVTTPLAVAEMDHLVARAGGSSAREALWSDLEAGAYAVEWWTGAIHESVELARRYGASSLGLTDASLVVLAGRIGSVEIATLDERHFRVVRPVAGGPAFELLPA